MPDLSRDAVLRAVMPIPAEAFDGPADPRSTDFVNNEPDCGVFGTRDRRSASEASTPPAPGRPTAPAPADWGGRGAVQAVDEEEWMKLRERLRDGYAQFLELIDARPEEDEELLAGIVGTVAHATYHRGALRQVALAASPATAVEGAAHA